MSSHTAFAAPGLRTGLTHLAGLLALSAASLAHAANYSGPLTVSLLAPGGITSDGVSIDPTPLNLTQSLTPGAQIVPGDGGSIGGFMLPAEFIKNIGTSFQLRVSQGASNGTTGYLGLGAQHARYQFDGLNITGFTITGLSYSLKDNFLNTGTSGASNEAALISGQVVKLLSPHSFEVNLDQIKFRDRGLGESNNFVDFRIDVVTTAVPEPSTALLALLGVAVLGLTHRARKR